nr:reverse transcriptase domain-containing protein [Tanacetum cinerariifolium]
MPFGLRNAGATYQRLVEKVFRKQIDKNLEVYVDDLVIKSRMEDEIVRDIKETFKTLREINMKLNPKNVLLGWCSTMCLGTPVISAGFQAKMSKLRWSNSHNLLRPPSVRVEPIITVCSGYSGFIATLTLSSAIGLVADSVSAGPETIARSSGTNLLLFRVITPPSIEIFSIS